MERPENPITKCGGLIADIARHTLSQSFTPNPVLAYSGALAAVAHLAGRRFRTAANTRPNLYVCAHGWSGVGKESPRKTNREIVKACGMIDTIGDDFRSGEAIQDALLTTAKLLCQYDEVDALFETLKKGKDTVALNIMGEMLKQWGSSASFAKRRLLANSRKGAKDDTTGKVVYHPHFTLFATGITKQMYKAISDKLAMNGFFARLIMFDAGKRTAPVVPVYQPIADDVVARCRMVCGADENPRRDLDPKDEWTGNVVPETADAKVAAMQISAEADTQFDDEDDGARNALWSRAFEKCNRLALVLAISDEPGAPAITAEHYKLAHDIVWHSTVEQLKFLEKYGSETDYEDLQKQFLNALERGRTPHRWLLRNKLRIPSEDLRELAETLREAGRIIFCDEHGVELQPTEKGKYIKGCYYELV